MRHLMRGCFVKPFFEIVKLQNITLSVKWRLDE